MLNEALIHLDQLPEKRYPRTLEDITIRTIFYTDAEVEKALRDGMEED